MVAIAISNFSGMVPLREPSLLDDGYAQYSVNTFLYRGSLRGFRSPQDVYKLKYGTSQSVYRIPSDTNVKQNFANSYWFEFSDPYLTVLRAPMIEDVYGRYYFFPSKGSPYFNTLANLQALAPDTGAPPESGPHAGYTLGMPAPTTAPTVVPAPGSDESRTYVYTWLNQFNEEGPPSPFVNTPIGAAVGTWNISITPPSAAELLNCPIVSANIYRTVTDSSGNTSYYLVAQLPIATLTFADNLTDEQITANVTLPSATWTGPPSDLQGVVQMANGIMAGWSNKKEIWFSEAYQPHAWPAAYSLTVPYPIVALAAVGSSLMILTEGQPWTATGVTPGTMTIGGIAANEPCISRGSVVAAGEGVYYASPNGLMLVNTSGTEAATTNILQKEDWINTDPYDHAGGKYANAYVAFIKNSQLAENGLIIDHGAYSITQLYPAKQNTPFSWLELLGPITNVYNDELSGQMFAIAGGLVAQWNPENPTPLLPYIWRSKNYRFPFPQQFVAGIVHFNIETPIAPAPSEATRNTSQTQNFDPSKQYLLLRVFADGRQVLVREIQKSGELILLPSGFKALFWSFQFEGTVEIVYAQFASSTKELRKV